MKFAHFDPFAGAAGDMILGALVDAGLDLGVLSRELAKLGVGGFRLSAEKVQRGPLAGTRVLVEIGPDAPTLPPTPDGLAELILGSGLGKGVRRKAAEIVRILGRAEAAVHGVDPREVHFHEVGSLDALVDITGAAAAVELMGIGAVTSSPVTTGSGKLRCKHGTLPVPAPATAEILRGVPTRSVDSGAEMTTPTGAAVLRGLCSSFGPRPDGVCSAVGYGAGSREEGPVPNLLRVFVGTRSAPAPGIWQIEVNLDDITPELLGGLFPKLLEAGALDAWVMPATMKKNRPGFVVAALCTEETLPEVESTLLRETTTLGLRRHRTERTVLPRETMEVETGFGPVRVKVGILPDGTRKFSPEYDDCLRLSESTGQPLREVFEAAMRACR
jgi:uncharacterized protein (TIGR00299 family) protein